METANRGARELIGIREVPWTIGGLQACATTLWPM
jgi:hypothetical protein